MAVLGWEKLQYGFNFIDEGMYMTDGWRMAAGDRLFPDNSTNVTLLYTVFNKYIFKCMPDITLLGFRRLQFFAAAVSMLILALSVYTWTKDAWYLPYALSLYVFTGLDVNGMASNLSYYVYPHLFLVLHIAFSLFALKQRPGILRYALFMFAGFFLWGIGFSILPLTVTLVIPLVEFLLLRKFFPSENIITHQDLALLYGPAILAWTGFIAIYGSDFLAAALKMFRYSREGLASVQAQKSMLNLARTAVPYVFLTLLLVGMLTVVARRPSSLPAFMTTTVLSVLLLCAVNTDLLGFMPPFWNGWFNAQIWHASLVITSCLIIAERIFAHEKESGSGDTDKLLLLMVVPCIIVGCTFVIISSLRFLALQFVAIPVMLALSVAVSRMIDNCYRSFLLLMMILLPFYSNMALADWNFTYFDLPPKYLQTTFEKGFAKGIRTNQLYYDAATWMESMAKKYSNDGDYAIIGDQAPMGYMLIRRRPSLNHSWGGLSGSVVLRHKAIRQMKRDKREPSIAFRFMRPPLLFPDTTQAGKYSFGVTKNMNYMDPVDNYLLTEMRPADRFFYNGTLFLQVYVR